MKAWRTWLKALSSCGLLVSALLMVSAPSVQGVIASAAWNAGPWPLAELPVVLQSQPSSCGPATLATLAIWLGENLTEEALIALTTLSDEGISLAEFARIASLVGFPGAWYAVRAPDLYAVPVPFAAHLEGAGADAGLGHLVAVAAVSHGYMVVGDPAEGAYVLPVREFARRFTGRVFVLESSS